MGAYPSGASVLEPAVGLLTNLLLRNPDAAEQAAQSGAIEALVDLMGANAGQGAVLRQACMAIRNMVVRNPELRPQVLSKGAEELLRAAKKAHPGCRDVASAALRDLGLDNYQN
jgi:armadillo repeat-containing protein 6